jgi:hypothetical protein
VSRFSNALLLALALHALFFVRTRHAMQRSGPLASETAEQLVELEESSSAEPLSEVASASSEPAARDPLPSAVAVRAASAAVPPDATYTEPAASDAPSSNAVSPDGVAAPEATAGNPERKIDLGLDGHFFIRPPSEELPRLQKAREEQPPVRKSSIQHQLEASLAADDVQRGFARGNALLSSLDTAVRDTGPTRGEALLSVTVGADGSLTNVQILRGAASDWSSALQSFRELAVRKRVRVPRGAHGLRITFSVKAKVQRPSGKEVDASGVDVAGPSLAPGGLSLHGSFDLADLAGGPQRLVYAHVLSEEIL